MSDPVPGWDVVPLGHVLTRITYGFTNPMPTTDDGPFMVTAKDVRDGRIDYNTARHTSVTAYEQDLTDKSRPNVGDVLITKDGSIGRVAVVDRPDICINQSVALLQLNDRVDSRFLAYLLQSSGYQARMAADADGSTIKHIYITRVDKMRIPVPALHEQRGIAEVLGALDDKIAANADVVATADSLAAASVSEMLVDAEPRPLSGVAEFVNGKAFTKGASGTGRVVIRIAELNSGIGGSTVYNDIEVPDQHLARPGDLLFAWSGSLTVHRWYRPEGIVNQHIFKVIPKDGLPMWCVNALLRRKLAEFKAIAADKATTMGHIQRHHLDEPVLVPTQDSISRNDRAMTALWDRALVAEMESLRLADTRDALLPLLMSGKVRVRDAEKVVEGVV